MAHHRILAADVIGGQRQVAARGQRADQVPVGERRLDHQHVGPLVGVEQRLAQRLATVADFQLVSATVAERRRRARGLAEGPVEGGSELRRVGEDRGVGQLLVVERRAQHTDPAVHHVRRRDDVRAGAGVADRRPREQLERLVVEHASAGVEHATVPVVGVLAEAHVGDQEQLGLGLLDRGARELHDALVVPGRGAPPVLVGGEPEEQHTGEAELLRAAGLGDRAADRKALDAGHRLDRLALSFAERLADEQRQQQPRGIEIGLVDELAHRLRRAQAAHPRYWEGHACSVVTCPRD